MDFFKWVHYGWHEYLGTMMTLSWKGAYDVIFCIWSMQAREFNNDETVFLHCISLVIYIDLTTYSYSSKGGTKFW